jgi:hypothetical protein
VIEVGRRGFEPLKSKDSGFTVHPIWPLWNLPGTVAGLKFEVSGSLTLNIKPETLNCFEPEKGLEPPTS